MPRDAKKRRKPVPTCTECGTQLLEPSPDGMCGFCTPVPREGEVADAA